MATANIPETPSRVNRPARGLDAFFANYAETTRKDKEGRYSPPARPEHAVHYRGP